MAKKVKKPKTPKTEIGIKTSTTTKFTVEFSPEYINFVLEKAAKERLEQEGYDLPDQLGASELKTSIRYRAPYDHDVMLDGAAVFLEFTKMAVDPWYPGQEEDDG